MTGGFLLKPIAKVGNDTVRMYEFIGYAVSDNQIILERTAEKLAFKRIMRCSPGNKGGLDRVPENIKGDFKWLI